MPSAPQSDPAAGGPSPPLPPISDEEAAIALEATLAQPHPVARAPTDSALVDGDTLVRDTAVRSQSPTSEDSVLRFPGLDDDDERRMEDLIAARLFPGRAPSLRIGRYTLLERLGQGGMGIVYTAYDPELDRRVAIKLLNSSLGGDADLRLRREAQAMARVVHANVVSVIEVGVHESRTFVVMEYLRGLSLDRWAQRRPGFRQVLAVYVQAGRGLAAAHRAGLIHRDFKPHNAVLVEGGVDDGRVKVLDFGLARAALDEPADPVVVPASTGALAESLTQTGAIMGTPAYMAPEQLAGDPADARSDQFSFAVALYEALYHQLPFAADNLAALTKAVLTGQVRPPPSGSEVPAWVLRVVLRGLARSPADRFESMTAMCDALERDPAARRRTIGLALTLSVAVGAGGWGLAQLGVESQSRCTGPGFELGEVWSDARAAGIDAAFAATDLPYAADTARRVRPILDHYAGEWTAMRRDACEAHQRGEQSAALLDLRMACLDRRRAGLVALTGIFTRPDAATVERAVEAALTLPSLADCADTLALTSDTPAPDDPALAQQVAALRLRLAEIDALASTGRLTDAAAAAADAGARAEALGFHPLIAEAALVVGTIAFEQDRSEAADHAFSRAMRHGIEGRADRVVAEALIRRHFVRGVSLGQHERVADDDELVAAHAARFPADGHLQWLAHNNRGGVAYSQSDFTRARELFHRALAIDAGPTPLELARTRINLGVLEFDVGDYTAALASHRSAIAQATDALGANHPLVARLTFYEAAALAALGRRNEARRRLEAILAVGGDAALQSFWPLITLAQLENRRRAYEAARTHAARALQLADPADPLAIINAETVLAEALTDPDEALAHYRSALERCEATYGADHALTASYQHDAGVGLFRRGRPAEALPLLRHALATSQKHDPSGAAAAGSLQILAEALLALDEPGEALTSARSAVETFSALPGDHSLHLAIARQTLGRAHLAVGDHQAATAALRDAHTTLAARLDPDDPDLAETRFDLARALLAAGESPGEALTLLRQARDTYAALGAAFDREREAAERLLASASN